MITITEKRDTVELKNDVSDIVFEEHSEKVVRFLGIVIKRRKLDYKCEPKDECKKKMGFTAK